MIYRKRGAVARWENGTLVRVTESGIAIEEGETFECRPEEAPALQMDAARVLEIGRSLERLPAERLIISEGVAEHDLDGRAWREHSERIHAALVRSRVRALLDLGSFEDLADIHAAAEAMSRMVEEREAPYQLRFARNVTAALLPSLIGLAPPNVTLRYTLESYRPSYRIRPVTVPADLTLECGVTEIDRTLPVAVAILEPVRGLVLRVLVDDGAVAYPATVRVTRIDAVSADRTWYPYAGGSFGAEMML
jgi:hypothetical protein